MVGTKKAAMKPRGKGFVAMVTAGRRLHSSEANAEAGSGYLKPDSVIVIAAGETFVRGSRGHTSDPKKVP